MEDNVLKVMIWGMEAGRLYWNKERKRAFFTYNQEFLSKGLDIAPLTASIYAPLSQRGLGHAGNTDKLYAGLPEFIADSLPDHWGNTVFNQWAATHHIPMRHLTAVDRLAFIGKRSMGALEFEPAYAPDSDSFSVNLQSLYQLAQDIFTERQSSILPQDIPLHLERLYKIGTSAGGMRPKAIISINEKTGDIRSGQASLPSDYTYYIIKFNEGKDFPFTLVEKAYYDMAINAGITMMPSRLIEIDGKQHFLTQRFDREDGKKVHIQTLAAMNPFADSYEDLFSVCRQLRLPASEIIEQYRRMVFNVLAGNVDDHTKNFSFMMHEDGIWHITPAYDLTFSIDTKAPAYVNRHCLTINGKDDDITDSDLIEFAKSNGIKGAENILSEVKTAISSFPNYAEAANIDKKWTECILSYIHINQSKL